MACVPEDERHERRDLDLAVERHAFDHVHRVAHLGVVEEAVRRRELRRPAGLLARHQRACPRRASVGPLVEARPLEPRARAQHASEEFVRCGRREDLSLEAEVGKHPEPAAVVDVRVRKHHHVDLRRIEGKIMVAFQRFLSPPLIQAAVQQDTLAVDLDQMFRARGGARGAAEGKFHGGLGKAEVVHPLVAGTPRTANGLLHRKVHSPAEESVDG